MVKVEMDNFEAYKLKNHPSPILNYLNQSDKEETVLERSRFKFIQKLAWMKKVWDRGKAWGDYFQTPIVLGGMLWIKGFSVWQTIGIAILATVGFYLIGLVDAKYFKMWQEEMYIESGQINPVLRKMERDIEKLK